MKGANVGLCHKCLRSDMELIEHKGQIICMDCYHRSFNKKVQRPVEENPTIHDLKKKWESKNG